jgi:hypothetical protein
VNLQKKKKGEHWTVNPLGVDVLCRRAVKLFGKPTTHFAILPS